ncbi:MAG: ribosome small subunit-dependent GTPase A [Gemmatimonas sp.]|jgi:ribosome biogenesis GTPase|uniref:ribosome small subunit-dependent GTPase A n=1 Tax=Gemmatimonas sp. TaxID=1962908 RepID=UPI0031CABE3E|nr:ribosome small subunit-dependent GTPase A [Gemmatimonas sp.]
MTRDASRFQQHGPAAPDAHAVTGVVIQGTGGIWDIRTDNGAVLSASMRGRLKNEAIAGLKLAVGDRVTCAWDHRDPGSWTIADIHERRSKLARRAPGGARGERVVVANLDQVLVVFAAARPEPHPRMLDRFLVIAEANGLAARIVVNKCDLVDPTAARGLFAEHVAAGYPVHYTSVITGEGLDDLRHELQGRSSALSGPSGVGKSSLMNHLFPGLDLRTAAISDSVNKGRHTTVGAVLHPLPGGGFLADTPGLREVGLWGIDAGDIAHCFPEFVPHLGHCRFQDCIHTVEPGCAIRDALAAGTVTQGRYESYVKLREELESVDDN